VIVPSSLAQGRSQSFYRQRIVRCEPKVGISEIPGPLLKHNALQRRT
jgi:hypothetical protein